LVFFVYAQGAALIGRTEKEEFLNYYSSVLSDMNVDYRDMKISPENIRNIGVSISNFSKKVEDLTPRVKESSRETQTWFIEIIDEFYRGLSLWTERHADEIDTYERHITDDSPALSLMKVRLASQRENMRNVIDEGNPHTESQNILLHK
jgi:hypothetical protein